VQLSIRDDGVGFDPASGSDLVVDGHLGLVAMRERVELAGGRFQLDSRPGEGWW
jgi:signal transduction histidine kinase